MVSEEKRAALIAKHYRDSGKTLSKQLAKRNKELVWLFGLLSLTMLVAYYPDLFSQIVRQRLAPEIKEPGSLPTGFAGFILLFATMLLVGDIYNLSAAIEQTVTYLAALESALEPYLGSQIISRHQKRPRLLTQAALLFSTSFSIMIVSLTAAILWGDSRIISAASGWWFFALDLLAGAGILYTSVMFIWAALDSGHKRIATSPDLTAKSEKG